MEKRKLSQKERNEPVTKGFLVDNEYVTRSSLEEILDSKNYATKDYIYEMLESFEKKIQISFDQKINEIQRDNRQHLETILEYMDQKLDIFLEKVDARIERVERYLGLSSL